LGLLSFERGTKGNPDKAVAELLLDDLTDAAGNSLRGALAIALGLTGYGPAAPQVMELLRQNENEQKSAGHLCISLALLGERSSAPELTRILERSLRRPFLLRQSAVALGQLGDRNASMVLLAMVEQSDSVAVLAAVAIAIGRIGDRRSIKPLLALLADKELTKLARGFVAAALGGIGDKDQLPFNAPLTVDCNYTSSVDTLTNGITGVLDIL
jgi:HEAT repeat protein